MQGWMELGGDLLNLAQVTRATIEGEKFVVVMQTLDVRIYPYTEARRFAEAVGKSRAFDETIARLDALRVEREQADCAARTDAQRIEKKERAARADTAIPLSETKLLHHSCYESDIDDGISPLSPWD